MTETHSTGQEIQTEVLGVVRKSEEMLVDSRVVIHFGHALVRKPTRPVARARPR